MIACKSVITGTGSYVPATIKNNVDFFKQEFYTEEKKLIDIPSDIIAGKFQQITGIEERRYASASENSSDLAIIAARRAIEDAGIDPETIDQIILAHNFGNVITGTIQTDAMPALAARVKHALGIRNPSCVAYDILFGCPGWLQGVIQADAFIKAGIAKTCLVIGTETLSRVVDIYDRDSMIFSDGAGACIVEAKENTGSGVLSACTQSYCNEELDYLFMGGSYLPEADPSILYIKMRGRKVYECAMKHVPGAMKDCLDKSGIQLSELKKVFIHQANEKMDEGIIKKLYDLYGVNELPEHIMPMNIHKLGNSSVATIPTLFDMVRKGLLDDHSLHQGDAIMFASVGAGMNINAVCYRI
jgi:3-oxoacyl-[acyl-carrier-protein] synthase-3